MVEDLSSPNTVYDSAPLPLGDQDDQDNAELGLSNQYFGQAFFDLLNKFKNGEIRSIADSEMIPDINYQICFEVGVEDIAKILWTEDPIEQFYRLSILLPILREAGANGQWAFLTIEKITKELNKCLGSYSALNSFFAMEVLGVAKKQKEDPDLSVLQIPGDKQHVRYQEGFVGSKEEEFDRYVASRFGYSKLASNESYYRISDGLVAIIDLGGVPTHVMECDQDMLNKLEEIPFVGRDIWEFIRQFKAGNLDYLSAYMGLRQALLEIEEYSPDINSGSLFQKLLGGDWQRIDQLLLARNEIEDQLLDLAKTLHDQLLDKNLEVAYGGIRDVLSLRPDYMTDSLVWDEIEEAYKDNDINQAWQEVHYLLVASRLQQVKDSELINLITSIYDRVTKTTIRHQEDTAKEYDQIVKNLDSQEADNIAATEEILERFESEGTLDNISSYIEQYIESFTDRIMPPVEPIGDYLLGLGIDKEAVLLILATHSPFMRSRLWGDLGLDPGNFDITTQAKFLEYALRQDNTGFNNLRKVVYEMRACDRDLFFDTFIALEYGGDYGDILVDIAQEALPEDLGDLLKAVNESLGMTGDLASLFPEEVQESVQFAMKERFVEILEVAREVSASGRLEMDVFHGKSIEVGSLSELVSDIRTFNQSVKGLVRTVQEGSITQVTDPSDDRKEIYRFRDQDKQALLYLRPYGARSFDPQVEFGRSEEGVEASIGFTVLVDSSGYLSPYKSERASDELSIRLDREGRELGWQTGRVKRDPTRDQGVISLDIGSILGESGSFGTRIAKIIAAGNIIRAQRVDRQISLNHNTNGFDQTKHGTSEGFAELVRATQDMARAKLHHSKYRLAA